MQHFDFEAFSAEGRRQKGQIEATGIREARRRLMAEGLSVSSIVPIEARHARDAAASFRGFGRGFDVARFFADMSVLMDAGLSLDQALRAVHANASRVPDRTIVATALERLASGGTSSEALSIIPSLPEEAATLIASGERSARLPQVMKVVAADLDRRDAQRKKVIDTAVYPIFLLGVLLLALGVITFVLVPTLEPIFQSSGRNAPILIAALSGLREALSSPALLMVLLVATVTVTSVGILRPYKLKAALGAAVSRTPLLGRALRQAALARYLQSLALLVENTVPLSEALVLAARCCPVHTFQERLLSAREAVVAGARLSEALSATAVFPQGVVALIAIGDEVNRLPPVLENASRIMRSESQRLIERLLALMTPAITILLGLIIGGLVISVMTALLSINELSLQ
jgi:general secretion pathway protein F